MTQTNPISRPRLPPHWCPSAYTFLLFISSQATSMPFCSASQMLILGLSLDHIQWLFKSHPFSLLDICQTHPFLHTSRLCPGPHLIVYNSLLTALPASCLTGLQSILQHDATASPSEIIWSCVSLTSNFRGFQTSKLTEILQTRCEQGRVKIKTGASSQKHRLQGRSRERSVKKLQ